MPSGLLLRVKGGRGLEAEYSQTSNGKVIWEWTCTSPGDVFN